MQDETVERICKATSRRSEACYASGMDVVWHTLTWVDEKGETVFDPSATGDEAEGQRRLIDTITRVWFRR